MPRLGEPGGGVGKRGAARRFGPSGSAGCRESGANGPKRLHRRQGLVGRVVERSGTTPTAFQRYGSPSPPVSTSKSCRSGGREQPGFTELAARAADCLTKRGAGGCPGFRRKLTAASEHLLRELVDDVQRRGSRFASRAWISCGRPRWPRMRWKRLAASHSAATACHVQIRMRNFSLKRLSASHRAATAQRRAIFPPRQRFTLCVTRLIVPCMFSIAFVEHSVRWSAPETPSAASVSLSSSPSRSAPAAPGDYSSG